jgi:hypothetical protein
MSPRLALYVGLGCALLAALLVGTGTLRDAEEQIARPVEYGARTQLGFTKPLDPRVKIFAWDDRTVAYMRQKWRSSPYDVPLKTWARFFEVIAARRPAFIWVDRVFEHPIGAADADDFVTRVGGLGVPVFASAYVTHERAASSAAPSAAYAIPEGLKSRSSWWSGCDQKAVAVGPNGVIAKAFGLAGHINLDARDRMQLFRCLDDQHAVPHWALTALGGKVAYGPSGISVEGRQIATTERGELILDLLPAEQALESVLSMSDLIDRAIDGKPIEAVSPGDVVVVLPHFYTGNADFKDTPVGPIVGGLLHAFALDALLTGDGLSSFDHPWALAALGVTSALAGGLFLSFGAFWIVFAGVAATAVAVGVLGFAAMGVVIPWLHFLVPFGLTGAVTSVERQRVVHVRNLLLNKDLQLGRTVQDLLLADLRHGSIGPWDFEITWKPYGPMSGDWVQVFRNEAPRPGEPLGAIAIGDVVGKGPSAALNTAVIASVWKRLTEAPESFTAERFARELDSLIKLTFRGQQNTTLSLAILYESEIHVTAFGAPHWLHLLTDGTAPSVQVPRQNPLGLGKLRPNISSTVLQPRPGELLVGYTDGVVDGARAMMEFRKIYKQAAEQGALDFATVLGILQGMTENHALPDDFTLLQIRRSATTRGMYLEEPETAEGGGATKLAIVA